MNLVTPHRRQKHSRENPHPVYYHTTPSACFCRVILSSQHTPRLSRYFATVCLDVLFFSSWVHTDKPPPHLIFKFVRWVGMHVVYAYNTYTSCYILHTQCLIVYQLLIAAECMWTNTHSHDARTRHGSGSQFASFLTFFFSAFRG